MSSSTAKWQSHNNATIPEELTTTSSETPTSFKITALPETDIWRRSDDSDVFTAPIIYQSLPASHFKSLSVTVFAPWKTQYDQGGLIIAFPSSDNASSKEDQTPEVKGWKWIKAGIEYHNLQCILGVVGTDRYSDWSLTPMDKTYHQKATFKAMREGTTLWIYAAQAGSEEGLVPVREIKWAFLEGRIDQDIWVGVYAAKPTEDADEVGKGVEVTFEDLVVEREE